jgi:2'-5' RNA ligase
MNDIRRTALVVVVPVAEALVGDLRLQHDRMAALGVPAHVTVLHPFIPNVHDGIADRLAELCAGLQPFDAWFASTGRFPGGVVWLDPQPNDRFVAMLRHVQQAFPEWPPYGGAFDEPVPHLTIASGVDQDVADQVDRIVTQQLVGDTPITMPVRHLTLLEEHADKHWTVGRTWPLGPR